MRPEAAAASMVGKVTGWPPRRFFDAVHDLAVPTVEYDREKLLPQRDDVAWNAGLMQSGRKVRRRDLRASDRPPGGIRDFRDGRRSGESVVVA